MPWLDLDVPSMAHSGLLRSQIFGLDFVLYPNTPLISRVSVGLVGHPLAIAEYPCAGLHGQVGRHHTGVLPVVSRRCQLPFCLVLRSVLILPARSGGFRITVSGVFFGKSPQIWVGDRQCTGVRIGSGSNNYTCVLPPGKCTSYGASSPLRCGSTIRASIDGCSLGGRLRPDSVAVRCAGTAGFATVQVRSNFTMTSTVASWLSCTFPGTNHSSSGRPFPRLTVVLRLADAAPKILKMEGVQCQLYPEMPGIPMCKMGYFFTLYVRAHSLAVHPFVPLLGLLLVCR